jgi:hypothetical protein
MASVDEAIGKISSKASAALIYNVFNLVMELLW